jgi:hypothetical protein
MEFPTMVQAALGCQGQPVGRDGTSTGAGAPQVVPAAPAGNALMLGHGVRGVCLGGPRAGVRRHGGDIVGSLRDRLDCRAGRRTSTSTDFPAAQQGGPPSFHAVRAKSERKAVKRWIRLPVWWDPPLLPGGRRMMALSAPAQAQSVRLAAAMSRSRSATFVVADHRPRVRHSRRTAVPGASTIVASDGSPSRRARGCAR